MHIYIRTHIHLFIYVCIYIYTTYILYTYIYITGNLLDGEREKAKPPPLAVFRYQPEAEPGFDQLPEETKKELKLKARNERRAKIQTGHLYGLLTMEQKTVYKALLDKVPVATHLGEKQKQVRHSSSGTIISIYLPNGLSIHLKIIGPPLCKLKLQLFCIFICICVAIFFPLPLYVSY